MKKWIARAVLAVVVCAAAIAVWQALRPSPPRAVFLIVIDTLRADRLSCYGYKSHQTANIDALADRGVLFENAFTNASWTVPGMGTIMTSLYPTQLGLVEQPASPGRRFAWRDRREQILYTLSLSMTTLAEVFHGAGYQTAGFVNQPALNNRDGFVQGFDDWFYPVGGDTVIHRDPEERLLENTLTRKALTTWQHVDRTDSALVGTFVEWMETAPREDSFVWLHLLSPHKPYTPPPGHAPPRSSGTERDPNMDSELYNGEIRYSDHLMSKVLEAIDRRVGLDKALVVFTSDHGEEFGDHGMDDHGHSLHREIVHVPLIMSAPNLPAGRRVEQTVSLIDLYPTILSLCGMSNLATPDVEGTDMTPLVAGRGPDRVVFAEGMLYGSTERALQVGGFRLMWDEQGDAYRLFRVSADPGETLDVSARFKRETGQLRTSLVDMHKFVLEDFRRRARGESAADSLATARERERVLKAMKSLGYINE